MTTAMATKTAGHAAPAAATVVDPTMGNAALGVTRFTLLPSG